MTKIKYEKLRVYKYILTETHIVDIGVLKSKNINTDYYSLVDGVLGVKQGYMFDGASGPAIDTDSIMRAALCHDALYQMIRVGKLKMSDRKAADKVFYRLCIEDGVGRIRSTYMYLALRLGGRSAALKGLEEQR